ncbi:MAG: hypothetical protein QOD14_2230 [Solirubrobacterales bacterium]|jgi:hypothetical protein|nr:hypothetical protein [Solirubrobacterales bacterium]
MRTIGKIAALCLALVLTLGLAVAADAAGKKSRVSSAITLQSVGPDGADGSVASGRKACRTQRRVMLYRVNSGASVPSSEPMASTWSRGDGSWTVPGPLPTSQYFAVVERKRAAGVVCGSSDSNARYF